MSSVVIRAHWYHPEWCTLAVAAGGWLVLGAVALVEPGLVLGMLEVHTAAEAITHSAVMSAAMMAPLVIDQVNYVAVFSLWRRRYRAAACYLAGYLGVWTLVGAAMMFAGTRAAVLVGWRTALAATFAIAVTAAASRRRRYRIRQCWATRPMAAHGWRADRDCLTLGLQMARQCVAASWALMLAVIVQHGLVAMAAATALTLAERKGRLQGRQVVAVTAILGMISLALTTLVESSVI
jgi:hypothetical protein